VQINQLAGQMLLASPSLQDAHFKDAVILVCHYDQEGGMGLIINRPRKIVERSRYRGEKPSSHSLTPRLIQ